MILYLIYIWLWHGDLYRVSPFQVYRTSTSCLQCNLEFFMFAIMKTFVTVISASTGRNDFIFDIWLWHGDLYRVSPFQIYRTSTSCLLCDLNERVGVFLARCSVQHLVVLVIIIVVHCLHYILVMRYWNLPLKSELETYVARLFDTTLCGILCH